MKFKYGNICALEMLYIEFNQNFSMDFKGICIYRSVCVCVCVCIDIRIKLDLEGKIKVHGAEPFLRT
jgi:hypothetical protein